VFTSPGQTKSDFIADILFREVAKEFTELRPRTDTSDGDVDKEARFWMLTKTHGRAVLLESMFHTNRKECKILMSDEGKERIAKCLLRAILRVEYLAEQGEIR
jgi:N-acetylmuramoyl-L-alanine amidase